MSVVEKIAYIRPPVYPRRALGFWPCPKCGRPVEVIEASTGEAVLAEMEAIGHGRLDEMAEKICGE